MFFGLSPLEIVVLAGLGLALFGPDKLPGAVRETARIVRHIKEMGDGARAELLEHLGPEFAELDPRRLNPRTLAREKLSEVFEPALSLRDDVRGELRDVRNAVRVDDHADRLAAVEAVPRMAAASAIGSAAGGSAAVAAIGSPAEPAESAELGSETSVVAEH